MVTTTTGMKTTMFSIAQSCEVKAVDLHMTLNLSFGFSSQQIESTRDAANNCCWRCSCCSGGAPKWSNKKRFCLNLSYWNVLVLIVVDFEPLFVSLKNSQQQPYDCYHLHSHSASLSLYVAPFQSLSLSISNALSLSLSYSLAHSRSLSLILSLSLSLILSLSLNLFLLHSPMLRRLRESTKGIALMFRSFRSRLYPNCKNNWKKQ